MKVVGLCEKLNLGKHFFVLLKFKCQTVEVAYVFEQNETNF